MSDTYYWTVNGVPACQAQETLDHRLNPATYCATHTVDEASGMIERVRALYPDADFDVLDGPCPARGGYADE